VGGPYHWRPDTASASPDGSEPALHEESTKAAVGRRVGHSSVFISTAEHRKLALARPVRDLLARSNIQGIIVSDEPMPAGTFSPEEKVDAYLERSDAMVVLATADMADGADRFTRLNIPDEIARARRMPHLRGRILVLKERGVALHSNINPAYENPAYEALDSDRPAEAFRRTLLQLREWDFDDPTTMPEARESGSDVTGDRRSADSRISPAEAGELVARASALVPEQRHITGALSLAVIVVAGPRYAILRPAELENPALARRLTQDLLFGDPTCSRPARAPPPRLPETA
jgi:hypothetical protein